MDAAKRVLHYLCSTSGMGLVLGGRGDVVLTGHSDASWVDDQATQRSSQGYTFSLGSGSVSWRSTRSSSVLGSSCEAEIYATAMAAQELRLLTYLLTDLGEWPRSPPVLYVDNKAAMALCQEHILEHRTKHIALRYFLAGELQQRGQLHLTYVAIRANSADIFTKALPPGDHQRFCTLLGLVPTLPHLLLRGDVVIHPELALYFLTSLLLALPAPRTSCPAAAYKSRPAALPSVRRPALQPAPSCPAARASRCPALRPARRPALRPVRRPALQLASCTALPCSPALRALLPCPARASLSCASRPAAARVSRPTALRVAPCCNPLVALCCSARRTLLPCASRLAAARASRSIAPRVAPYCSPRVALCCPALRALLHRPAATTAAAAARATAAAGGGAAGSAGGAAGAGGVGGAARSTGGAAGAGGAGPTTDSHCLSWPLSRQLQRPGVDSSGHCLSRTTPPLSSFRCVPGSVEAAALSSSESAAAPGEGESATAVGARESADALGASASTATVPLAPPRECPSHPLVGDPRSSGVDSVLDTVICVIVDLAAV
ncbi:unnamed protein product [Closterium sp. NIES-53]